MDLVEIFNEGLVRKCEGKLEPDELDERIGKQIDEIRPTLALPGFRVGKAPNHIIRARFTAGMKRELIGKIISDAVSRHLEETGNTPAVRPQVDLNGDDVAGQPIEVMVEYECMPTMPEIDFSDIPLTRLAVKDVEPAVQSDLDDIASALASFRDMPEDYEAAAGDQVTLACQVFVDGEERTDRSDSEIAMRAGARPQSPPPFGDNLLGVKSGDSLNVNGEIPEHPAENAKLVTAEFKIEIRSVKQMMPAEMNDELVKRMQGTGLEEFTEQLRRKQENWFARQAEAIMLRELLDELDARVDFELPPTLLAAELQNVKTALEDEAGGSGDPEAGEAGAEVAAPEPSAEPAAGDEPPDVPADGTPPGVEMIARRRLKLGMFLIQLAKEQDLRITENDVMAKLDMEYPNPGLRNRAMAMMNEDREFSEQLSNATLEHKVLRYISSLANVTVTELPHDELAEEIRQHMESE